MNTINELTIKRNADNISTLNKVEDIVSEALTGKSDIYCRVAQEIFNVPYSECCNYRDDYSVNTDGRIRRNIAKGFCLNTLSFEGAKKEFLEYLPSVIKIEELVRNAFPFIPIDDIDNLDISHDDLCLYSADVISCIFGYYKYLKFSKDVYDYKTFIDSATLMQLGTITLDNEQNVLRKMLGHESMQTTDSK